MNCRQGAKTPRKRESWPATHGREGSTWETSDFLVLGQGVPSHPSPINFILALFASWRHSLFSRPWRPFAREMQGMSTRRTSGMQQELTTPWAALLSSGRAAVLVAGILVLQARSGGLGLEVGTYGLQRHF